MKIIMIVNPQFFNYRLIIGSLIVAFAVLSIYSFTTYQSIRTNQQFLNQEKKFVSTELSQMISRYDDVSITNDLIASQLKVSKKETKTALDSLMLLHGDLSVILKSQQHFFGLRSKNKLLFKTIDSLDRINKKIRQEKLLASNKLEKQRKDYSSLLELNKSLNDRIEKAALLTANSFKAKAYKYDIKKKHITKKATNAESIEVCFVLAKNALAKKGKKDIYIQILNPENNVLADKGVVRFGDSSLIYSIKKNIEYNNEAVDVCINIKASDRPLIKGTYFIQVFYKDQKLGGTQIELN